MGKTINWDSLYVKKCFHEKVICYGKGAYCVYFWQNSFEEPFYVGMGKNYRFWQVNEKTRSKEFMEVYRSGNCSVKIVAYGMDEQEARRFEKKLILTYNKFGFPLVNKQYLIDHYHTPAWEAFRKRKKENKTISILNKRK